MPASFSENLKPLEEKLGHSFRDKKLLLQALTHKSYSLGESIKNYEILEFLGDSIINLLVVDILVSEFKDLKEGELASMKAFFVSEDFLVSLAQGMDLGSYILANGRKFNIRSNASVMADVFEALWASVYLDSGKDLNYVRELFNQLYRDLIVEKAKSKEYKKDYKTLLQELTQKRWKERPAYRIVSVSGPQHSKQFWVECSIREYRAVGTGTSKKEAEQSAAKKLLDLLHQTPY